MQTHYRVAHPGVFRQFSHLSTPPTVHPCKPKAHRKMPAGKAGALNDSSSDPMDVSSRFSQQQVYVAAQIRPSLGSAAAAAAVQQQLNQPNQQVDTDLLWAGYSDLSEQLRKMHAKQESLVNHIHELQAKIQVMQQQPPASAWQAASFLLFFLGFINFMGLLANFHLGLFLPWVAVKNQGSLVVKELLGVVLPMTNTTVVLIFCLQAIKAAWACLRW